MSKFILAAGLLVALLTGLAGAMPLHVSTQPMRAAAVGGDIGIASGPFATYEQAAAEKRRLEAQGFKVSGPRDEGDGWWIYY
jgi:hypothetical protein